MPLPSRAMMAFTIGLGVGVLLWTLLEYVLHRFVFHGLQPFRKWHALHHQRPTALIFTPTLLSALVIAGLVFVPALLLGNVWTACAFTLGVQTGNLGYSIIHHGIHHWRADSAWLKRRKLWHAVHHRGTTARHCFGVTTSFWDHVFRSAPPARERAGD